MKIPDVVLQEASEAMEMLEGTLIYISKIGDGRDVKQAPVTCFT
jgi:hypothetical protein